MLAKGKRSGIIDTVLDNAFIPRFQDVVQAAPPHEGEKSLSQGCKQSANEIQQVAHYLITDTLFSIGL